MGDSDPTKNTSVRPNPLPAGAAGKLFRASTLTGLLAVFVFISSRYFDFVPFWDGGWYWKIILEAALNPFQFKNYAQGYNSSVYIFSLAATQWLDAYNVSLLYWMNTFLAAVSIVAFYHFLCLLYPSRQYWIEKMLVTAIYAFSPILLPHIFHINMDFGVLVFSIPFYLFLLKRNYFCAFLFGTALSFSKTIGFALYMLGFLSYLCIYILPEMRLRISITRQKVSSAFLFFKSTFLDMWWLILPPLLYLYTLNNLKALMSNSNVLISNEISGHSGLLDTALSFNPFNPVIYTSLFDIFVLNFHWVISLLIACAAFAFILRGGKSISDGIERRTSIFLLVMFAGNLYALTRYLPFNNYRYLISIFPLLYALFLFALLQAAWRPMLRRCMLVLVLLVTSVSNFRTIDPVSKHLLGTFSWGTHEGLLMGYPLHGFTGVRDQLVYNMEYLKLHYLSNKAFAFIKPGKDTLIVAAAPTKFFFPGRLDSRTFRRTSRKGPNTFLPNYLRPGELFERYSSPKEIYVLDFPNMPSTRVKKTLLKRNLQFQSTQVINIGGYQMKVHHFENRAPSVGDQKSAR